MGDLGRFYADLIDLANVLGFTFTTEMLQAKSDKCSDQKDKIFGLKAGKLREIGAKIYQLDELIAKKHNLIEHEINARLSEAQATSASTEQKISDVQIAVGLLQEKLEKSERLIDQLLI